MSMLDVARALDQTIQIWYTQPQSDLNAAIQTLQRYPVLYTTALESMIRHRPSQLALERCALELLPFVVRPFNDHLHQLLDELEDIHSFVLKLDDQSTIQLDLCRYLQSQYFHPSIIEWLETLLHRLEQQHVFFLTHAIQEETQGNRLYVACMEKPWDFAHYDAVLASTGDWVTNLHEETTT